jgi:hypothetical protein
MTSPSPISSIPAPRLPRAFWTYWAGVTLSLLALTWPLALRLERRQKGMAAD